MTPNTPVIPVSGANLPKAQTSRQIPIQIPAATSLNGQVQPAEIPITLAGSQFYLLVTSAPITIQAMRGGAIGASNSYNTGQGQFVNNQFDSLIAKNYNLFAIVALVWVGFDEFIDNQLILNTNLTPLFTYATQSTPTATNINIVDQSGQQITDINGSKFLAVSRQSIIISNVSTGTTILLQKFGSVVANGPSVLAVPPGLPLAHNSGGKFCLNVGGGVIQAIVSETYLGIPVP